jgi:hypothetical protein
LVVKNGSKMRSRSCSGTPEPQSAISRLASLPSVPMRTAITARAGAPGRRREWR